MPSLLSAGRSPTVVWRAGLDLNPLDVTDPAELVRGPPGHWIANEGPDVLPYDGLPEPPSAAMHSVLALDGRPLAWTRPHGQAISWFA